MSGLVAAGYQLPAVEKVRREVDNDLVGAIVFLQEDSAGVVHWVQVVETL